MEHHFLLIFFLFLFFPIQVISFSKRCNVNSNHSSSRIAIGFYGMSRSLNYTYGSIVRHVFNVLDRANISYDVFWSVTTLLESPSSENSSISTELDDIELIRPCKSSVIDQTFVRTHEFKKYFQSQKLANEGTISKPKIRSTSLDFMKDNYTSVQNILSAYYTLDILNKMILTHASLLDIKYDAFLILRPDCAIISDIDLPQNMKNIKKKSNRKIIYIPNFQQWGGYNDRAAYGPSYSVSLWMKRLIYFRTTKILTKEKNPESALKLYLLDKNITVLPSTIRLIRVRQHGIIEPKHDLNINYMKGEGVGAGERERGGRAVGEMKGGFGQTSLERGSKSELAQKIQNDLNRCRGERVDSTSPLLNEYPLRSRLRYQFFKIDSEHC